LIIEHCEARQRLDHSSAALLTGRRTARHSESRISLRDIEAGERRHGAERVEQRIAIVDVVVRDVEVRDGRVSKQLVHVSQPIGMQRHALQLRADGEAGMTKAHQLIAAQVQIDQRRAERECALDTGDVIASCMERAQRHSTFDHRLDARQTLDAIERHVEFDGHAGRRSATEGGGHVRRIEQRLVQQQTDLVACQLLLAKRHSSHHGRQRSRQRRRFGHWSRSGWWGCSG